MMKYLKNLSRSTENLLKVLFVSGMVTAMMLLLLALLARMLDLQSGVIDIGITLVYVVSCFCGGLLIGKVTGSRKYLWGMLTGLLYFVLLFVISSVGASEVSGNVLWRLLLCLGGGMLGGMIS